MQFTWFEKFCNFSYSDFFVNSFIVFSTRWDLLLLFISLINTNISNFNFWTGSPRTMLYSPSCNYVSSIFDITFITYKSIDNFYIAWIMVRKKSDMQSLFKIGQIKTWRICFVLFIILRVRNIQIDSQCSASSIILSLQSSHS